ncbi:cold shock domain-containing protein [Kistimonas scapharcae]|uniref:cold shock domain-containing protein n=1 Tax=Kistimonas scapharcae TaxID=1036133 RepID=UPI0031E5552F
MVIRKGFGFISASNKNNKIFFHISSLKTRSRRPEVGNEVDFELGKDKNGKTRAKSVSIEGIPTSSTKNSNKLEPPRKNIFDYLLIVVAICSVGFTGYKFYEIQNYEIVWPFVVPAIISFLLLGRNKKPKQDSFSCSKCRAKEKFNPRTIAAWNRGMTRLFCNKCHSEWIRNNPKQKASYSQAQSGCLGTFLILSAIPIIGGIAIYQWLV